MKKRVIKINDRASLRRLMESQFVKSRRRRRIDEMSAGSEIMDALEHVTSLKVMLSNAKKKEEKEMGAESASATFGRLLTLVSDLERGIQELT